MSRPGRGLESKSWTALAVTLAAFSMLSLPTSAVASPWSSAQLSGEAGRVFLLGISCPTQLLCVAVGTDNLIASSSNPAGGTGAWDFVYAGEGRSPEQIGTPTPSISGRQIQGVSCPTMNLCVAVMNIGNIYSSTNPTGPASSWRTVDIDGNGPNVHLYGISCPSASLCVAVAGKGKGARDSGQNSQILTTIDPTGGASAWQKAELTGSIDLRAVSCGSPTMYVAVGLGGQILNSTDPSGGPSAWRASPAPGAPGDLGAVSCIAAPLCVVGNEAGNLLTSTNPAVGASSWKVAAGGDSVQITGVSCASANGCVAVDNNGDVLTSTDPTGGPEAWSHLNIAPYSDPGKTGELPGNGLFSASCPSASFCAVTGALGQIFTSTAPFAKDPPPSTPTKMKRPRRPRVKIAEIQIPLRRQIHHKRGNVLIRFHAYGRVRRFECGVDRGHFKSCRSPWRRRMTVGRHIFRVRAIGLTGLRGPIASEEFFIGHHCVHRRNSIICQH
jgi:hypothetical protein